MKDTENMVRLYECGDCLETSESNICPYCGNYMTNYKIVKFVYNITIEQWKLMSPEQQEEYIITNNIQVGYSTDISDTLSRGFGHLDQWGFWEYQCKNVI